MSLYPLKFTPILKERIWGGNRLRTVLSKENSFEGVGESWEISTVEGSISVVANGTFKDTLLTDLIVNYSSDLLGHKVVRDFGLQFPILIKFLDAAANLSIQVHPDDRLAKERHDSLGKNEMWYVMEASPEASLIVGFTPEMTPEKYQECIAKGTIEGVMEKHPVRSGDAFFIEAGTVHAIGAGILLAEIQQTSDVTYRVYDFNRKDAQGNLRELHTELAVDAINFKANSQEKCVYTSVSNTPNEIITTPYFTTNYLPVQGEYLTDKVSQDSFTVYICVQGSGEIQNSHGKVDFLYGETVLIPANSEYVKIISIQGCVLLAVQY